MNIFDKALGIMQERGMCKGTQEDRDGHVCVYGALNIAKNGRTFSDQYYPECRVMDNVARELFPARYFCSAAAVNNHPDTTQEDVELILKHAAYEWDLLHPEG